MQKGIPILLTLDEQRRTLQQDMIPAVRDTIILRMPGLAHYVVQSGVEGQYRGITLHIRTRGGIGDATLGLLTPVESWAVDGNDITAEIALASDELNRLFKYVSERGTRILTVVVQLDFPRRVLALGDFILRNNPVREGGHETHPSPTVAQQIAALRDELESVATLFLRHGHDGEDTQKILHAALIGAGVLTHERIDKALTNGYPVNLRICNAIKKHDTAPASHNTRFTAVEDAHANHVLSDATTGNNVHGILSAIKALIDAHNNSTLSHDDLRALLNDMLNLLLGMEFGKAFDDVVDMNAWIASPEGKERLRVGFNLFIRNPDVPDYWWDGTQAIVNPIKLNLDGYATLDDIEALRVIQLYAGMRRIVGLSIFAETATVQSGIAAIV